MIDEDTLGELISLCEEGNYEELSSRLLYINSEYSSEESNYLKTLLLTDSEGNERTLLHIAVANGHIECVRALLLYGFSPKTLDDSGNNSLHIACYGDSKINLGIINLLISHVKESELGAFLNVINEHGTTALWNATYISEEVGNIVIETLLENGADPNVHGSDMTRPLWGCFTRRHVKDLDIKNFKTLLEKGADYLDSDNAIGNALHQLIAHGNPHKEMLDILYAKAKEDGKLHDLFVRCPEGTLYKGVAPIELVEEVSSVVTTEKIKEWFATHIESIRTDIFDELGLGLIGDSGSGSSGGVLGE